MRVVRAGGSARTCCMAAGLEPRAASLRLLHAQGRDTASDEPTRTSSSPRAQVHGAIAASAVSRRPIGRRWARRPSYCRPSVFSSQ